MTFMMCYKGLGIRKTKVEDYEDDSMMATLRRKEVQLIVKKGV